MEKKKICGESLDMEYNMRKKIKQASDQSLHQGCATAGQWWWRSLYPTQWRKTMDELEERTEWLYRIHNKLITSTEIMAVFIKSSLTKG